jgi:Protein of unknown function (DUF3987)
MARKLGNWILSYASGIDDFTEAPTTYCIWAAISVVGAVMKKNVWRKRGVYTIYPNQYVVLTGPPGIGKGEAIHPVYNIAKDLKLLNIISDRITAPKIIDRMAQGFTSVPQVTAVNGAIHLQKDSSAVLFSTELQSLLTSSDWMLQFLCDAWDKGEYEYDTKNSGTSLITGMCTSLIGACVPEYIRKLNKDSVAAINGGFTARSIFVYAENPSKRLPNPPSIKDSTKGKKLLEDLADDLGEIAQLKGEMRLSPAAQIEWNKFYLGVRILDNDSDVVMHFKRRMPVHVLKLSMIFSASYSSNMEISREDMLNAIKCLGDVLANLDKAFRGVGESELAESSSKIQGFIERKGITSRSEILTNMHRHITSENLDRVLTLFANIGVIDFFTQGKQQLIKSRNGHKAKPIVTTTAADLTKTGAP